MTGPEHYREAERLTELANSVDWQDGPGRPSQAGYAQTVLACAQAHATLALAAATAEPIAQAYDGDYDTAVPRAWSEAIS